MHEYFLVLIKSKVLKRLSAGSVMTLNRFKASFIHGRVGGSVDSEPCRARFRFEPQHEYGLWGSLCLSCCDMVVVFL